MFRYFVIAILAIVPTFSSYAIVDNQPIGTQEAGQSITQPLAFQYVSPYPGSTTVSAGTTIAVRNGQIIDQSSVQDSIFVIFGDESGSHAGRAYLANDNKTVIFAADSPFAPGERVRVAIKPGLRTLSGNTIDGFTFDFLVSPKPYPYTASWSDTTGYLASLGASDNATPVCSELTPCLTGVQPQLNTQLDRTIATSGSTGQQTFSTPNYVTAPDLLPSIAITLTGEPRSEGLLFSTPFWWDTSLGSYLIISDDRANLVYYRPFNDRVLDFKRQPNGLLTYFDPASGGSFKVLDSNYELVDSWSAGNGYHTDVHDLQLLSNGHALLMIYDLQPYDLSPYGGPANGQIIDLVLQEIDQDKNVVFEWNSRNHIAITDTYEPLSTPIVDYVHGNAVELDSDGNLLLSSRHLSEITKIDRNTGQIIWRLGGKNNQFSFVGDTVLTGVGAFSYQHDIRRLANGNITLFDNGNQFIAANMRGTRGVEYSLDEVNHTAALVREYRTSPDIVSLFMGNVQRLPNGNTLIGWGGGNPNPPQSPPANAITEFSGDGNVAMELTYAGTPFMSYRGFRFPWQGFPGWSPTLVAVTNTVPAALYYSWNGATEVFSYTVYSGVTPDNVNTVIDEQPKTGFEDSTALADANTANCFYRVLPYDKQGRATRSSAIVYLGDAACDAGLTTDETTAVQKAFHVTPFPPAVAGSHAATVTVSLDAGAVQTSTVLVWGPRGTPPVSLPAGTIWTGLSFSLRGFAGNVYTETPGTILPYQLIIDYSGLGLPHEPDFRVGLLPAGQSDATLSPVQIAQHDIVNRRITILTQQFGEFVLLAGNHAPLSTAATLVLDEDTPHAFAPLDFPYFDADGDPLAGIVVETMPLSGSLTLSGTQVTAGQDVPVDLVSSLVYTPTANENGLPYTSFQYAVDDSYNESITHTFTIVVRPVNDPPVAVDDLYPLPEKAGTMAQASSLFTIPVLDNDYDVDGDNLTIIAATTPEHGNVTWTTTSVAYTPSLDYMGVDSFDYVIRDTWGATATATVHIAAEISRLYLPALMAPSAIPASQ